MSQISAAWKNINKTILHHGHWCQWGPAACDFPSDAVSPAGIFLTKGPPPSYTLANQRPGRWRTGSLLAHTNNRTLSQRIRRCR